MDLNGKVVAITGAYRGLGAALAEAFARKGCKLVLGGRNEEELNSFADKLSGITEILPVVMDVRNIDDCKRFVDEGVKEFGSIDLFVNNAGIWDMAPIEDVTQDQVNDLFSTNIFGMIYCCKFAVLQMKKQKNGIILNIGSTSGLEYKTHTLVYSASKAAVIGFTTGLNEELKGTGVRAMCFSPGGIRTDLFRNKPEKRKPEFMDPKFVAANALKAIEDETEWSVVLRRPQ